MRSSVLAVSLAAVSLSLVACNPRETGKSAQDSSQSENLADEKSQISYIVGRDFGENLKSIKDDIDLKVLTQAMQDAFDGKESKLSKDKSMQIMQAFAQRQQEKQQAKAQADGEKHLAEGKAFLAANQTKDGVQTTASGLQYKVMRSANGKKPKASDQVKVHYKGTLLDGTKFDSSYDRGEPAQFGLAQVVPGWTEGLQLMPVGSKYTLWIPSELGYGASGTPGGPIPPNSTLVFEVELLEILKQ